MEFPNSISGRVYSIIGRFFPRHFPTESLLNRVSPHSEVEIIATSENILLTLDALRAYLDPPKGN